MKKQIKGLEEENAILKKAMAIFTRDGNKVPIYQGPPLRIFR